MNLPSKDTLYLIDISSFIFRAFFAIRQLNSKKGEPTNAVYGVAQMLQRVLQDAKPEHLAVVFDSKEPSFRKEVYAEYKANRSAPPDDLIPQFDRIEELVQAMRLPSFRKSGVEADDLIATLTHRWRSEDKKHQVCVVTGDKDLMQLVDGRTQVWDTMKGVLYGVPEVREKFGIEPSQIRDYLALTGDSSDNIPGVPSIGPKGAVALLLEHGDLEGILKAAKAGKIAGKKGETIAAHESDARLSAELATLKSDIKIDWDPAKMTARFEVTPELEKLFLDLSFDSLLAKWKSGAPSATVMVSTSAATAAAPAPASAPSALGDEAFVCVRTRAQFDTLMRALEKSSEFGFDLETTSLNPREAQIVGVALALKPTQGFYIPVGHTGEGLEGQLPRDEVLARLKPILENPRYKKIGQNLKYDWSVCWEQGIRADGIGADTMVASYVLDPSGRHNLDTLCEKYLSYKVLKYEDVCGSGKDQIPFAQVPVERAARYSAEDALCALWLWRTIEPELHRKGLMEVFARVELPLVPVLARMEAVGVAIDSAFLKELSGKFETELREIEAKVHKFSKKFGEEPLNLNSPKQLGKFLFEDLKLPPQGKTKTGYSTDASVLEALAPLHEVPKLLLEFREISKLKGTYVDPLPELVDAKDGRVHGSFHQTVAATGRLSSSDPNLQNIPIRSERGRLIRRAFVATPGHRLLSADYSQIELRILAHMSGDPDLSASFKKDEDVHRRTASEIFHCSLGDVTDDQRAIAKAINFGLMYGKTAFGLAEELGIPRKEAKEIIDRYFTRYRGVKEFLDGLIESARERGYTETLTGRKRLLPELHSKNPMMRQGAERMAMNTPIQGTAADLIKLAMIELDEKLRAGKYRTRMTIQVHDELVLEVPEAESTAIEKLVVATMEGAMKLDVPLKVNTAFGRNWYEC